MILFEDIETCGLHGMPVLIQYAIDDGDVILWDVWHETIEDTLQLLESFCEYDVCGFNLAFDWFGYCKLYTILRLYPDWSIKPKDDIDGIALLEKQARFGPCLKPKRALDLMLHARKGPYQSLMARDDIRIKRVPTVLAYSLAKELEDRVEVDAIYFAKRKDKWSPRWAVLDIEDDPDFKDVILRFNPSGALKTLASHALKIPEADILRYSDIEVDKKMRPKEYGYAPFAEAVGRPGRWNWAWPEVIRTHIDHWRYNPRARKYAGKDVEYTRGLYHFFKEPEFGDDDSELACMVAAVRWHGFVIDDVKIKDQKKKVRASRTDTPVAPKQALYYIREPMLTEVERMSLTSTAKAQLEKMVNEWPCDCTYEMPVPSSCELCGGSRLHPSASRAQEVLDARRNIKEEELYDKLLRAERFHASFVVIGALSSRMAGADGLNAQGINHKKDVRACFTLADAGYVLCGGDFDSFEVVLAEAAYNDAQLRRALVELKPCAMCDASGTCYYCKGSGKCGYCKGKCKCSECDGTKQATNKIHALYAMSMFPGKSYADVIRSKGSKVKDYYTAGKQGVFSKIYGGDWSTLVRKQGLSEEVARAADESFGQQFPGVREAQRQIFESFCSMRQPGGIGSKVIWHEPTEYVESLMGFRRYFTLENNICRALFQLANRPPKHWKDIKTKVRRRDRDQYVGGAVSSALYGAAFGIQSCAMRAAANHVIQSSGATITKHVQRKVWDLQPHGVHDFKLLVANIHDELLCPCKPEIADEVQEVVYEAIESFRERVPLIAMTWQIGMKSWAEK